MGFSLKIDIKKPHSEKCHLYIPVLLTEPTFLLFSYIHRIMSVLYPISVLYLLFSHSGSHSI